MRKNEEIQFIERKCFFFKYSKIFNKKKYIYSLLKIFEYFNLE
jgi:hypothetical protein